MAQLNCAQEYFAPSAGFTPPFDPGTFTAADGDLAVADGLQLLLLGSTEGMPVAI